MGFIAEVPIATASLGFVQRRIGACQDCCIVGLVTETHGNPNTDSDLAEFPAKVTGRPIDLTNMAATSPSRPTGPGGLPG